MVVSWLRPLLESISLPVSDLCYDNNDAACHWHTFACTVNTAITRMPVFLLCAAMQLQFCSLAHAILFAFFNDSMQLCISF